MKTKTGFGVGADAVTPERLAAALELAGRKVGIGAPRHERRVRLGWFKVELAEIVKTGQKE
jgi:hypothetical protein